MNNLQIFSCSSTFSRSETPHLNTKFLIHPLTKQTIFFHSSLEISCLAPTLEACLVGTGKNGGDLYRLNWPESPCNFIDFSPTPPSDSPSSQPFASIEGGIQGIWTSPDFERILILSTLGKIMLLDGQLESMIWEGFPLDQQSLAQEHVSIGWGSKATQFHGSEGKEAAIKPLPRRQWNLATGDDFGETRVIGWRNDSKLWALTCVQNQTRIILWFDRQGQLIARSNPDDGQEGPLQAVSWKGRMISGLLEGEGKVFFWEPNGLRHGEPLKLLNEKDQKLLDFSWNCSGTILGALILTVVLPEDDKEMQNSCSFNLYSMSNGHWYHKMKIDLGNIRSFSWDIDDPMTFHVSIVGNDEYQVCKFTLISKVFSIGEDVYLLDGSQFNLTQMSRGLIPPPLFHTSISISSSLDLKSSLWEFIPWVFPLKKPSSSSSNLFLPLKHHHPWTVALDFHHSPQNPLLIKNDDNKIIDNLPNSSAVCGLFVHPESQDPLVSFEDGTFYFTGEGWSGFTNTKFGFDCLVWARSFRFFVVFSSHHSWLALYSWERGQGILLEKEWFSINSFTLVYDQYLCFSNGSLLRILNVLELESQEWTRSLELGSSIVCWATSKETLILQLPRGNLEGIVPRPLALHVIQNDLLTRGRYLEAFQVCRRNRLDFNILLTCSFDPSLFIDQLCGRSDYLNLFFNSITDLNQCEIMRLDLQSRYPSLVEPILTALAREGKWIEALQRARAEPSLIKFLSYLSPGKSALYHAALESLDWECAFAVAQQSQMDPQEYRPFLASLKAMPLEKAKFTVLDHIGKHKEALSLLFIVDPASLADYVKIHNLFPRALEIATCDHPSLLPQMALLYAENLKNVTEFEKAYPLYLIGGKKEEALSCLLKMREIERFWPLIISLDSGRCESLLEALVKRQKFHEASLIALNHLGDRERALELLINGHLWLDALRLFPDRNQDIGTWIRNRCWEITQEITQISDTLKARITRLEKARADWKSKQQGEKSNSDSPAPDNVDLLSTISTAVLSLGSTHASTKSRRKITKAKARAREGGVYEEDWLLLEVQTCFKKTEALLQEKASISSVMIMIISSSVGGSDEIANSVSLLFQVEYQFCILVDSLNASLPLFDNPVIFGTASLEGYVRPWEKPSLLQSNPLISL